MSYRELRNFGEILKILGYPRIVSIENFRTPNFALIYDILRWFVKKFDPEIELPSRGKDPQERVELLRNCARLLLEKSNVKLNLKKLYQADGHAVQELLKLATLLYKSTRETNDAKEDEDNLNLNKLNQTQIMNKINEIKNARSIASEITLQGADLYDMLTKEAEIRDYRNDLLSMPLQLSDLEQKLRESIKITQKNIESINYKIDNVALDESNLDQKIEQKKQELDRQMKRFDQLQLMRPQFLDEFEKLESEFEIVYEEYINKFCSLVYLEDKLDEYDRFELEASNEREKKRKELVEQNQLTNDFDDENLLELNESDEMNEDDKKETNSNAQDRKRTSRIKTFENKITQEDKEDSFDDSFNLEDNEIVQDDEDNSDLDSEDELELINLTNDTKNEVVKKSIQNTNDSDNDF